MGYSLKCLICILLNFYINTISTVIQLCMILTKYKKVCESQFSQMKSTVTVITVIHFKLENSKENKDQDSCILVSGLFEERTRMWNE